MASRHAGSAPARVLAALEARRPQLAHAVLREMRPVPVPLMTQFYEYAKRANTPLHTHLFATLVQAELHAPQQFVYNFARVIVLYLLQDNYEQCLAFVRSVERANKGTVPLAFRALEMLVKSAKWHDDVETAQAAVEAMRVQGYSVYSRTWGMLLQLALDVRSHGALVYVHKHALVPGFLVADDASYLRMAALAAEHGDLHLCEWAALRMRRRQRTVAVARGEAAPLTAEPGDAIELKSRDTSIAATSAADPVDQAGVGEDAAALEFYTYLIEAAAVSSLAGPHPGAAGLHVAFRYIGRLGQLSRFIAVRELPSVVRALGAPDNEETTLLFFDALCQDRAADEAVKVLVLNLLLAANLRFRRQGLAAVARIAHRNRVPVNSETLGLLINASSARPAEWPEVRDLLLARI